MTDETRVTIPSAPWRTFVFETNGTDHEWVIALAPDNDPWNTDEVHLVATRRVNREKTLERKLQHEIDELKERVDISAAAYDVAEHRLKKDKDRLARARMQLSAARLEDAVKKATFPYNWNVGI